MTEPIRHEIHVDIRECKMLHEHPSGAIVAAIRGQPFNAETAKHYRNVFDAAVEAHSAASFRLGHGTGWTEGREALRLEARERLGKTDQDLADAWAELDAARAKLEADEKAFRERPIVINVPAIRKTVTVRDADGNESTATIEPVEAQGAS